MNFLLPVLFSLSLTSLPHLHEAKKEVHQEILTCQQAIKEAEREHGILPELLGAVARVESGRMHPQLKKMTAWPWTICHKGKPHYFPNKKAALHKIQQLKKQGAKDFDIGLLQVNNYWHNEAFDNAEEALDPKINARYAAKFLRSLYDKHKSWTRAVSCYHSCNPRHGNQYCRRVMTAWSHGKRQKSLDLIDKNKQKQSKLLKRKMAKKANKKRYI